MASEIFKMTMAAVPINIIVIVGGLFLYREINQVKKIVTNGLSHKVHEISDSMSKMQGFCEAHHDRKW